MGTFVYSKFKLTWLGLASLREGPAAVPAYGGCSLTAYCTVNPVTVTGLSMPTWRRQAQALIGTVFIRVLRCPVVRVLRYRRTRSYLGYSTIQCASHWCYYAAYYIWVLWLGLCSELSGSGALRARGVRVTLGVTQTSFHVCQYRTQWRHYPVQLSLYSTLTS